MCNVHCECLLLTSWLEHAIPIPIVQKLSSLPSTLAYHCIGFCLLRFRPAHIKIAHCTASRPSLCVDDLAGYSPCHPRQWVPRSFTSRNRMHTAATPSSRCTAGRDCTICYTRAMLLCFAPLATPLYITPATLGPIDSLIMATKAYPHTPTACTSTCCHPVSVLYSRARWSHRPAVCVEQQVEP